MKNAEKYQTVANTLKGDKGINENIEAYAKFYTSIANIFRSLSSVLTDDNKKTMTYINGNGYPLKTFIDRILCSFKDVDYESAESMKNINKDFSDSIMKSNEVLNIIGKVLPVTLDEMNITAELQNGYLVTEKSKIDQFKL